jgi:hypothetical protein
MTGRGEGGDVSKGETTQDGTCPRCAGQDCERELILQTTMRVIAGVVFFCPTCGLTSRALSTDREAWFDTHHMWASGEIEDTTYEAFAARWDKQVGRPAHGGAEPLGPILPVVDPT